MLYVALFLLFPGLQHQKRTVPGLQAERMGHRRTEEDQAVLEELFRKH